VLRMLAHAQRERAQGVDLAAVRVGVFDPFPRPPRAGRPRGTETKWLRSETVAAELCHHGGREGWAILGPVRSPSIATS